jgi:hypothetical protein
MMFKLSLSATVISFALLAGCGSQHTYYANNDLDEGQRVVCKKISATGSHRKVKTCYIVDGFTDDDKRQWDRMLHKGSLNNHAFGSFIQGSGSAIRPKC